MARTVQDEGGDGGGRQPALFTRTRRGPEPPHDAGGRAAPAAARTAGTDSRQWWRQNQNGGKIIVRGERVEPLALAGRRWLPLALPSRSPRGPPPGPHFTFYYPKPPPLPHILSPSFEFLSVRRPLHQRFFASIPSPAGLAARGLGEHQEHQRQHDECGTAAARPCGVGAGKRAENDPVGTAITDSAVARSGDWQAKHSFGRSHCDATATPRPDKDTTQPPGFAKRPLALEPGESPRRPGRDSVTATRG